MSLSTRLTAAMVMLVLLTVAAVDLLTYWSVETTILPGELERVDTHARVLTNEIEAYARVARADVITLASAVVVNSVVRANLGGGVDPRDGTTEEAARQQMASRFEVALGVKPSYMRLRLIGLADNGRELVRVDRSPADGTIHVVTGADLEQRGDRNYFKDTIHLARGDVYVSPIERNQETKGAAERPAFPVMRAASPLFTPEGAPFGIVIINVDMRPAFAAMRAATGAGRQIFVVNEDGDYLIHPDPEREFAFESGRRIRWQDDFP
jgi:hypothetical protein